MQIYPSVSHVQTTFLCNMGFVNLANLNVINVVGMPIIVYHVRLDSINLTHMGSVYHALNIALTAQIPTRLIQLCVSAVHMEHTC